MIEPGLYEIDAADYHRDPCPEASLSNSLIPLLLQAPAKARLAHPKLNAFYQPAESSRLDLGSVAHKLLLGKGRDVAVLDFDSYRTDAAKEARDEARGNGRIPILAEDFRTCEAMRDAAVIQLEQFRLLDHFEAETAKSELALLWHDAVGCWGRNLIDRLRDDLAVWEIWDYKTRDGSVRPEDPALAAHFVDMGYDTQFAMQERGLETLYPHLAGRVRFRTLWQEINEPYLISVTEPDPATMLMARKKVDYAFKAWVNCLRSESWAGYTRKVVPLRHNEWKANQWLEREIAEDGKEPGLLVPPPPPKRGRGRPFGSKNKSRKQREYEARQKSLAAQGIRPDILDAG